MRGFAPLLILFGIAVLAAVVDFTLRYEHPDTGRDLDVWESIYVVFTLLLFGGSYPWPDDLITRLLFFAVPLLGIAVIGQGVLGLTSAVFNRRTWEAAVASTYENHVILCGLGRVGFRVLAWLRKLGEDVVLIETDGDHPLMEQVRAWKIPTLVADARRPEILMEAGIRKAESIVPCTNDDLINLSVATAARAIAPDIRVVIRTFDDNLAMNLQKGFDINFAYSTSALAAPAFAAAAMKAPVDYAFAFGEDQMLLTVSDFTVIEGAAIVGQTVGRVEQDFDVEVLALQGNGTKLNPPDDTIFEAGQRFIVSAPLEAISKLAEVTPPTRELGEARWRSARRE